MLSTEDKTGGLTAGGCHTENAGTYSQWLHCKTTRKCKILVIAGNLRAQTLRGLSRRDNYSGHDLRLCVAITCYVLRPPWSSSKLHASKCKFLSVWPPNASWSQYCFPWYGRALKSALKSIFCNLRLASICDSTDFPRVLYTLFIFTYYPTHLCVILTELLLFCLFSQQSDKDHCLLLALPCGRDPLDVHAQTRALKSGFINYLQQKQAAGIINVARPGSTQVIWGALNRIIIVCFAVPCSCVLQAEVSWWSCVPAEKPLLSGNCSCQREYSFFLLDRILLCHLSFISL